MFSTKLWALGDVPETRLEIYAHILNPPLWNQGREESEALEIQREHWTKPDFWQIVQPTWEELI